MTAKKSEETENVTGACEDNLGSLDEAEILPNDVSETDADFDAEETNKKEDQ